MRKRQMDRHLRATSRWKLRGERGVHSGHLLVHELDFAPGEVPLVGRYLDGMTAPGVGWRRLHRGRHALNLMRSPPHSARLYGTHPTPQRVGAREVPSAHRHYRATLRVAHPGLYSLHRRLRGILELNVRELIEHAVGVGHVNRHPILVMRGSLALGQGARNKVSTHRVLSHPTSVRRLEVFPPDIDHRAPANLAVDWEDAVNLASRYVLVSVSLGVSRSRLALHRIAVHRELHVHETFPSGRRDARHKIVVQVTRRSLSRIHPASKLHVFHSLQGPEVGARDRENVPTAGRSLVRIKPLHLGHLIAHCDATEGIRSDQSGRRDRGLVQKSPSREETVQKITKMRGVAASRASPRATRRLRRCAE